MQLVFLKSFSKDLDNIKQPRDKKSIIKTIDEIKKAQAIGELSGVKKLVGFQNAYRIRSGDYRIGIFLEGSKIEFARVAHRKDIYKIFP